MHHIEIFFERNTGFPSFFEMELDKSKLKELNWVLDIISDWLFQSGMAALIHVQTYTSFNCRVVTCSVHLISNSLSVMNHKSKHEILPTCNRKWQRILAKSAKSLLVFFYENQRLFFPTTDDNTTKQAQQGGWHLPYYPVLFSHLTQMCKYDRWPYTQSPLNVFKSIHRLQPNAH